MEQIIGRNAQTLVAVEREREREYPLEILCANVISTVYDIKKYIEQCKLTREVLHCSFLRAKSGGIPAFVRE